jgi:protein TonB
LIAPQGSGTDTSAATAPGGGTGPAGESGGGGHGGGGGGGGGDGSGGAQAAYGTNPLPPYPLAARRLGMEGVTLLDVLVAPDGKPVDVRVQKSSGFASLDDSALKTVRERWRFVPAREGGTPVESRVTVPIRFRLSDAGG